MRALFLLLAGLAGCAEEAGDELFPGAEAPVHSYAVPLEDPELRVTEFQAANASTLRDATGERPDWIELHSLRDEELDLRDYCVTDDLDTPCKFRLGKGVSIPAHGYLLLLADGEPREGPRHLGFKLSRDAEAIGVYRPDGLAVDTLEYFEQVTDWSSARIPEDGDEWYYDDTPTPGGPNAL